MSYFKKKKATNITYDNSLSGLSADDVKEALDEVAAASGGIDLSLKKRTEMEALFKTAESDAYKELTYDQGSGNVQDRAFIKMGATKQDVFNASQT